MSAVDTAGPVGVLHTKEARGVRRTTGLTARPIALWPPLDCQDDPDAIGPDQRNFEWGDVWRDYTIPGKPAYYTSDYPAKASVSRAACEFTCDHQATRIGNSFEGPPNYPGPRFVDWQSPARVEVRAALADLPLETPTTFTLTRTSEPPD